ncbi:MAG: VWA domain-containing protein, partial [Candidatus Levybacteria bacterium]|nr:VWA domain-containing protein [Candidatus Levybacteria bacterium]
MKISNFKFQIGGLCFRGRGDIYVVSILAIIIIASAFLVGGVYPDLQQVSDTADTFEPKDKKADKKNTGVVQLRQLDAKKKPRNQNNNNQNRRNRQDQSGKPPACTKKGAIAFLIDVSESMAAEGKLTKLKEALNGFVNKLPSGSLVALYTFSDPSFGEPKERASFGSKTKLPRVINGLSPEGATYMLQGFQLVQQKLSVAKDDFPNHQFSLILVSDGVPELIECDKSHMPDNTCRANRNYDYTQDPTLTNIPDLIKDQDVRIYSIAIYDKEDLDVSTNKLIQIMQSLASPDSYFDETANGGGLDA